MQENNGITTVVAEGLSLAFQDGQVEDSEDLAFEGSYGTEYFDLGRNIVQMECNRYENGFGPLGIKAYIDFVKTDMFSQHPEYDSAKQWQIFSVSDRIIICKCDDQILWANGWREGNRICVGKGFIHKNCLFLSETNPTIEQPDHFNFRSLASYLMRWTETKYVLNADWDDDMPGFNGVRAMLLHAKTGMVVPNDEAKPIMTKLGYGHNLDSWFMPTDCWQVDDVWFGFQEVIDSNEIISKFLLKSNENYNYGICLREEGFEWSYTYAKTGLCSTVCTGKATLDGNVLILNQEVGEPLPFFSGIFDSDVFFSGWPAWTGSKYFIPPTGKHLYYTETGNRVPFEEADPIMRSLGYKWYPSMMVGDTEAGCFWYKPTGLDQKHIH